MTTRQAVVAAARAQIGVRWTHQGRTPGIALDCIGLIGVVALAAGIIGAQEWADDPALHCYGRTPDPRLLIGGCDRFMDRIAIKDAGVADVLIMAFERDPQHFAIISQVDPTYLIHAYAQRRKVVENGLAVAGAKVLRAYRFRGIA